MDLRRPGHLGLLLLLVSLLSAPSARADRCEEAGELPGDASRLRSWIEEMKRSPRGPFSRIRWFCADGTVQPPRAYACRDHGGGRQHGERNANANALRERGYMVANVLAELDPTPFVGADADLGPLRDLVLERFLIGFDDGWIFRGARSYRGAFQAEDEEAGARRLALGLLADPAWRDPGRFWLLREVLRFLPLRGDPATAQQVRDLAAQIAAKDSGFSDLRAKIHSQPDAGDAARVRSYAQTSAAAVVGDGYEELAGRIEALHRGSRAPAMIDGVAPRLSDAKATATLRAARDQLASDDPDVRLRAVARLLEQVRRAMAGADDAAVALDLGMLSLALEQEFYVAGSGTLAAGIDGTRRDQLGRLMDGARALYGSGFLSDRQLGALRDTVAELEKTRALDVSGYRDTVDYLARASEWSSGTLQLNFGVAIARWRALEPKSPAYLQDRLRGSPLLYYADVVDGLVRDANELAGVEHQMFGNTVGSGLRALNAGIARGTLHRFRETEDGSHDSEGIYLLPETVGDLPRVAGILTQGEGSSLSHVQLLARNLGIPNVVVSDALLGRLESKIGQRIAVAVSSRGVVQIDEDSPRWSRVLGGDGEQGDYQIQVDLDALDLEQREILPLDRLRARDSGRLSGPKGANLGELRHHFGDQVPPGIVVPFGVFRAMLDLPLEPGAPSVWEWMEGQYDELERVAGQPEEDRARRRFLARLRQWIETTDPGPVFRRKLGAALTRWLGPDGSFGAFVRSDTNVEDLPGFTGAGLNLTLANVVGTEAIIEAMQRVWASPFTERAFGWRQANMDRPKYVFPAVVIQKSVNADKSGVLVTADVEGEGDYYSIAANWGVGGAVEGQSAEQLRVDPDKGTVRLLAQATAPCRATVRSRGGMAHVAAPLGDRVLEPQEIEALRRFGRGLARRFPALRGPEGEAVPADVEFAFKDGNLVLLQIRPLADSREARSNEYLRRLDAKLEQRSSRKVDLDRRPTARAS